MNFCKKGRYGWKSAREAFPSDKEAGLNRRKTGAVYEQQAADFLEERGYKILRRNYQNRYGELDLIAVWNPDGAGTATAEELLFLPGSMVVVCEIKYRRTEEFGDPAEAVTRGKIRHICRTTTGFYLEQNLSEGYPCRFDVISIYGNGKIRHIEDAFSFVF